MILRRLQSLALAAIAVLSALPLAAPRPAGAQAPDQEARDRAHRMLAYVRADLKEFYYDSTFGGVDMEARYRAADSSLDRAPTVQSLFGIIAQYLFDLNDSHTSFSPPPRAARVAYGWTWTTIGDACYVSSVVPGSDAQQKGLAVGDRVVAIDGMQLTRQSRWLIGYLYYQLNPRPGMRLLVQKSDDSTQELDILAKVTPDVRVYDNSNLFERTMMTEQAEQNLHAVRHRTRSLGDTVMIWRLRQFVGSDEQAIDVHMDQARQHKALILDLRDNPGGSVATELRLLGHFVDRPTRVLTVRSRDKREPRMARPIRRVPFRGNLVILLNANSASASEITTRFLQLEGKATVIGDRSAGAVMTSIFRRRAVGHTKLLPFGVSVTVSDVIMGDDGRLENVGVTPEFIVLPTGADLAARRDPQMARALAYVGVTRTPEEASRLFVDR